jgi:D-amino peptidase
MKVYISADMEGITGINGLQFIFDREVEYSRGRTLMMHDLNAAITGAVEAGATEILVNDAHGSMRNLQIEDLHEAADLITGFPKNQLMMAGLDASFDAAMFIGYHPKDGSEGILSHTIMGSVIRDVVINGKSYGETGICAAMAGHYDVPVVMVSGDNMLKEEARDLMPDIPFVTTKHVLSGCAAKMLHPKRTEKMIREQARLSLVDMGSASVFKLSEALDMEVTVKDPVQADVIEVVPGLQRTGATTVAYAAKDIIQAHNMVCTIAFTCCIMKIGLY